MGNKISKEKLDYLRKLQGVKDGGIVTVPKTNKGSRMRKNMK